MQIGHVHLKIRDLQRSVDFYRNLLGLEVTEELEHRFVFMSSSHRHHELALQEVGPRAATPGRQDVGLYHVAFEVPDRQAFAATFGKLCNAGVTVFPVDHGISWAIYFNDPDGNGIEVYWDTRATEHGVERWEGIEHALDVERLNVS